METEPPHYFVFPWTNTVRYAGRLQRRANWLTRNSAWLLLVFVIFPSCVGEVRAQQRADESEQRLAWRRPVSVHLNESADRLVVGLESGSIAIVDVESRLVSNELQASREIVQLEPCGHDRCWLLLDQDESRLKLIRLDDDSLEILDQVLIEPTARAVAYQRSTRRIAVSSDWSRRIAVFELDSSDGDSSHLRQLTQVDLDFSPGLVLWHDRLPQLLVADAFGGQLAMIDVELGTVAAQANTGGHNTRGMVFDDRGRLLMTQQILGQRIPITTTGIDFGDVIKNVVRIIEVDRFATDAAAEARSSAAFEIGFAGLGGGDPAEIVRVSDGRWITALSGVAQIAILEPERFNETRVATGIGPSSIEVSPDSRFAFVANRFSDTLSIVDLRRAVVEETISLGPARELNSVERGEILFFDARLSRDNWYSCHSCHTDGHSNGLLADTLGDGAHGNPKRILSLRGVGDTRPWAWVGDQLELESQIDKSITSTLHGQPLDEAELDDLGAFISQLAPPPPIVRPDTEAIVHRIERGRALFDELGCARCHDPNMSYSSAGRYDVGLVDELELDRFNPPSLLGVGHRSTMFHDGRARSLESVLDEFQHQLDERLDESQREDLLTFLRSL